VYDLRPLTYLTIDLGGHFIFTWPPFVDQTGEPIDFTADGTWIHRLEVRDTFGGNLLTRFHSNGTWDGTIFGSADGHLTAELTAAKTALLTPIPRAVFDLKTVDPLTGKTWRMAEGFVRIKPESTTDA